MGCVCVWVGGWGGGVGAGGGGAGDGVVWVVGMSRGGGVGKVLGGRRRGWGSGWWGRAGRGQAWGWRGGGEGEAIKAGAATAGGEGSGSRHHLGRIFCHAGVPLMPLRSQADLTLFTLIWAAIHRIGILARLNVAKAALACSPAVG